MRKNLLVLIVLTWVSFSYAKDHVVAHDTIDEAESYKIESAVKEQEIKRGLAGSKIKKKKLNPEKDESSKETTTDLDSEVRYWQYSE